MQGKRYWQIGKKGKKGSIQDNEGLKKSGFRPYQSVEGAGTDHTQNKDKGEDQNGKGKEGHFPQSGLSASETPDEEGYGHAWESADLSASHRPDDSWTSAAG